MRPSLSSLPLVAFLWILGSCTTPKNATSSKAPATPTIFNAYAFGLDEVRLLPGPFLQAQQLNQKTILAYEPDRLLAKFRKEAGLEPRAEHYHGWEDDTISGHTLGHYLTACAQMYKTTGDAQFLDRVRYIVEELARCQAADGTGYVAAIPNGKHILGTDVAGGNINAQAFYLNGLWAPFYNIHKMMAGLRDAYRLCNIEKALDVEKGMADWIFAMTSKMSKDQIQTMLSCEHGGMNEVLADLFGDTGQESYLALSRVFHHEAVLDPLSKGIDILPGIHGNTQIPKLIGLARRYELTRDSQDQQTARFFWDRVVHHHSYVTGGHGNHEYFGPPDQLRNRLSDETTETCNVYNMLKLTEHLFLQNPTPELADFTERALFNHILSSQHPQDGRVIYNLSLEMGGKKTYQNPYDFTCCVGSGMENHSKYSGQIYYHNDNTLFINQFIASELNWKAKSVVIRQQTTFPEEQRTTLQISCPQPVELKLMLRYPAWVYPGHLRVRVNGRQIATPAKPGSYVELYGKWKDGDQIELDLPFDLRLEPMPDDSLRAAICYGPLVLAGDLGAEDAPNPYMRGFVPVFKTTERDPSRWLGPIEEAPNTFKSLRVGYPNDATLIPFYKMHNRRYTVYWDFMSEEVWRQQEEAYLKEVAYKKSLQENARDMLFFGDTLQEAAHAVKGENTHLAPHQNRTYRQAERGGWFSCQLQVDPERPMFLEIEYWGGFTGSKTFDLLVDGQQIATENITGKAEGRFIIIQYPVPPALTKGKATIELKFQPHAGHRAGPAFAVWAIPQ